MPISDPERIDIVSTDEDGRTNLAMTAAHAWDGETLAQLHAKCQAYVGYVASGQFAADHPESEGAVLRLVHQEPLTPDVEGYLARLQEWLAQHDLGTPVRFETLFLGLSD